MSSKDVKDVEVNPHDVWIDCDVSIERTNKVLGSVRNQHKKLFDVVRESYFSLKDDKEMLNRYKTNVHIDRSSINKIIKIVESDVVMENLDKLPLSWGSLCLLTSIEEDLLVDLISWEKINRGSTQTQIKEIKKDYGDEESGDTSKSDDKESEVSEDEDDVESGDVFTNFLYVDLDGLSLSQKGRNEVMTSLQVLYRHGIEVSGVTLFDRKVS